ncbi:hypothetical protein ID866_12450 [Astraeus odoratus]|nr:hypothetical protein ID866_12450 [Astraeus odoratus]
MSTCKSSTIMGTPATKITDWTKVPDNELATDIDDTDSVGNVKAQEKHRRLCTAHDAEIQKAEEVCREAKWKCQVEEAEKHWKEEEERQQKEAEAEQKWKAEEANCCCRGQKVAAEQTQRFRVKKCSACRSCVKAKEQCGERKKQVKKAANKDEDDKIIILSGQKTKWQGGGKTLKEVTN